MLIRQPKKPQARPAPSPAAQAPSQQEVRATSVQRNPTSKAMDPAAAHNRRLIRSQLYDQIDPLKAASLGRDKLRIQIESVIRRICDDSRLQLSRQEEESIAEEMLNEMVGIGPIQPLLADDSVNDILVNGAGQVFVERFGKLELSPITFIDEEHVFNTAQRIAAAVGRRIDESHPMVDARLADGSRVNVITYPLAIDGTTISIRKFMRRNMSLEILAERGAMSMEMAEVLQRAMLAKLNIIVSGGTGAGKTTLLNALSQKISDADRIITIEDAAELQLQQVHVVRLETRPVSAEGTGKVDQRDLVRNALRMRPDRIILGEVRGGESFDMLQAMNTGHDGSLCTVHSNTPRDAIMRMENMVMMASMQLPLEAIRRQIASAVNLIVQIERMRDGARRVVSITEICGMENDVIQTQELFGFKTSSVDAKGHLIGQFVASGQRPQFYTSHAHLFEGQH
ncbi:pilus assembly protein CpaF [Pseudomonas chlororaphis]|jgi:pilus assembly protein CpaF|uniref:CpaF family protein n=1 Tax=Pseudomonas morbosilactucae TaxID=2938197 RepID=A0A9X1YWQ1_9PSED|nr:CpaF family protein [Pseudomonas morbosilactucae]MCK9799339.1 CpaF family protein [Pseudomonas morbosilactucae]MCK9812667.1 CpaF family protein [Pseudomonas morbosilactucae]ROL70048.1 pilus assembly protein CpaF [Pseudomonas chlororaphis]WEK07578.1 MAG: CpaF family protein [Pseudomonas sp.]